MGAACGRRAAVGGVIEGGAVGFAGDGHRAAVCHLAAARCKGGSLDGCFLLHRAAQGQALSRGGAGHAGVALHAAADGDSDLAGQVRGRQLDLAGVAGGSVPCAVVDVAGGLLGVEQHHISGIDRRAVNLERARCFQRGFIHVFGEGEVHAVGAVFRGDGGDVVAHQRDVDIQLGRQHGQPVLAAT